MGIDVEKVIASMKGISGTGNVLSHTIKQMEDFLRTLEPGDIAKPAIASAAPIGYDLWYLWCHNNFLEKYYTGIDGDHFDYDSYIDENLHFLSHLTGLKPLKTLRNLDQLVGYQVAPSWDQFAFQFENNGIYWINLIAWELWSKGFGARYPSENGPKDINDYVGYLTFPVGQLGVIEVLSLMQEVGLDGYAFSGGESPSPSGYLSKGPVSMSSEETPRTQSKPQMFPDMEGAGENHCYGRHLIESAYLIPKESVANQNAANSSGGNAYAPTPERDVELFASLMEVYGDVRPKKWLRYWIHKDDTLPVPGEFIGILCKPLSVPPHVWWFQESSPFLYAGNWMETKNLTSGVITEVTLEENRTDGGTGNLYKAKIQGCEVIVVSTDFFSYSVGDRVAILKLDSTESVPSGSFTWLDQSILKDTDEGAEKANYVIIPATFYKIVH